MYEIPQQLEYKEKIIFGLTFVQLLYALIFFPIIFFLLFKLNASIAVRVCLAIIPFALAVGFIFLNLSFHIKNWIRWFRFREIKEHAKIKKLFGADVKENLIILK